MMPLSVTMEFLRTLHEFEPEYEHMDMCGISTYQHADLAAKTENAFKSGAMLD
jgi:hypothetical protein